MEERTIRLLPPETIQQIAAAEVVENSASIVKELIDNAIDAGSSQITVETNGGGYERICLRDNGCGIAASQLRLAVMRHATSKLRTSEDLLRLSTLGFRGEALAAIAAVSKLTIISCEAHASGGALLKMWGGKPIEERAAARASGTTVEVEELFFNVPARKAFKKKDALEDQLIRKVLIQAIVAYERTAFEWVADGKSCCVVHQAMNVIDRFKTLFSIESEQLVSVEAKNSFFSLEGFISKATSSRIHRGAQFMVVNNRMVEMPALAEAIEQGYGYRLGPARHAAFVLRLQVPPELIDVNIHPQKLQVRLVEEKQIASLLKEAIEKSLLCSERPVASLQGPLLAPLCHRETSLPFAHPEPTCLRETEDQKSSEEAMALTFAPKLLCQMAEIFVLEQPNELIYLHYRYALERIYFEQLQREQKVQAEYKLFPELIEFSESEAKLWRQNAHLFERMGILARPFGASTYIVEAAPIFLSTKEALKRAVATLKGGSEIVRARRLAQVFSSHHTVTSIEAVAIFQKLQQCEVPELSPGGIPTYKRQTLEEMQAWF